MDTSGSEITAKIRSAIKAKLLELGAYVDDELPDYIMVMIANKKTKEQMTDDLNLFLGKNSLIFTNWVHGVLDRLQAISQKAVTSAGNKEKSANAEVAKKLHNVNSSKKEKSKDKATTSSSDKQSSVSSKQDIKENKPKVQQHEKRPLKRPANASLNTSQDNVKNDESIKFNEDDVLEMHADMTGDEFTELAGKCKESASSGLKTKPTSSTGRKRIEPPPSSAKKRENERSKKRRSPSFEKESSNSRKRRSVVGQVVHREEYESDEEEYDPSRPQLGSIVKVSQRKYNVSKEMQPKPLLFLKALTAANSQTKSRKKRALSPPVESRKKRVESPPVVRKRTVISDGETSPDISKGKNVSDDSEAAEFSDVEMADNKESVNSVKEPVVHFPDKPAKDTRRVELKEPPPPGTVAIPSEDLIIDTANPSVSTVITKFVVTLDGVDSNFVKKVDSSASLSSPLSSVEEPSPAPTPADSAQDVDDQDTLIVGVGDDVLDDQLPVTQINEVKICLDDDEDEELEQMSPRNSGVVSTASEEPPEHGDKLLERCKFYPSCKLGLSCQFVHPTLPCKVFPNCRFGDRCVYIHPNCRFDAFCTNKHCPYAHSSSRRTGSVVQAAPLIPKTVIKSVIPPCKYGSRCLNSSCHFKHPKVCIYGINCTRPDCLFSHPANARSSSPGDANKFRWIAAPNSAKQDVNE